jgi:PPM family protein phosphatase
MTDYLIASASMIGGRAENQDCFRAEETAYGLLAVVCDGMGGENGGRIAAELAVSEIFKHTLLIGGNSPQEAIANAITKANETIFKESRSKPWLMGMGTTVTALIVNEKHAVCYHAGDSRIYHLRHGNKLFRTFDHSQVFEFVSLGILTEEEARVSPGSNIITRALGTRPEIEITASNELTYKNGDRFLLCTDGIWGALPEIKLIQMASMEQPIEEVLNCLMTYIDRLGVENGGIHDNMTAILIEIRKDSV